MIRTGLKDQLKKHTSVALAVRCAGVSTQAHTFTLHHFSGWGHSTLTCRLLGVNGGLGLCHPCLVLGLARQRGITSAVSKLMLVPLTGEKRVGLVLSTGGLSNVKVKHHKILVPKLVPAR